MGLDIYAGTLTRYYCHNWKTAVQQWAEKNGYQFQKLNPEGEPLEDKPEKSPAEIQQIIEDWRDYILAALCQPGHPPYAPWPEDNEKPYYTDKPDWDALGALMLVAACHVYGEPIPPTVQKRWDFMSHPIIHRLTGDEGQVWSLFRGTTWWLPLSEPFLFQGPLPNNNQAVIGTVGGLRMELERLNQMAGQADEETVLGWAYTEGYPTDGVYGPDGKIDSKSIQEHTEYDTQSLAKFAFSILWQAVCFSQEQQVPILMDY